MEHDQVKAIELFDKLLDEGIEIHCDDIKQMCLNVGYEESESREIARIYDILSLYKSYKKSGGIGWDIDKLINP